MPGHLSREQMAALLDLWNTRKPPGVRPGSMGDFRWAMNAIWDIEAWEPAHAADPFPFIRDRMAAYLESAEAKKFPTSLKNFLLKGKFLETPDQWNHGGSVIDPHEETRIRIALSKGEQP